MFHPGALLTCALLTCLTMSAAAQGISGVTRRTTTLEKQAAARQFFDAAGVNVNGPAPAAQPGAPRGAVPLAARPLATTRPQPLVVQTRPTGTNRWATGPLPARLAPAARPLAVPLAAPATPPPTPASAPAVRK